MKKFHPFLLFLINSNIFVSFCVLSLALSSEFILGYSNLKVAQFVFFATILTYNFQRIVRVRRLEKHPKSDWIQEHEFLIYVIMIIAASISLYRFLDFKTSTKIAIIFSGVLSFLYPFWLRKIPFSKIFIIALVWTISTMLLLILENNIIVNSNITLHLFVRFLFVVAICIPFDIRDLKIDSKKLKTIPIIFGVAKAKLICFFSLFSIIIISIFQFLNDNSRVHFLIAIILSCIVSLILINKSDEKQNDFFFSLWIESLSIFLYLFLAICICIF